MLPTCEFKLQVTAVLVVPLTVAANCWVCDCDKVDFDGLSATMTGGFSGDRPTVAVDVPPLGNVAVTVTVWGVDRLAGAVNRAVEEMLPEFGLMLHRTVPWAVNCWLWPATRVTLAGVTVGFGCKVITARAVLLGSATLMTMTPTVVAEITEEGAVYTPEAETVPTAGETDQLTPVFPVPVTVAVNA
jgi:hypothetical protein